MAKSDRNLQSHRNRVFVGRQDEMKCILQAAQAKEASILIVYGRRRVGKTELIEHTLSKRNLLKLDAKSSTPSGKRVLRSSMNLKRN